MKLICKYSGIEYAIPHHFQNNHRQLSIHPIFSQDIPVNYLLSRTRDWVEGKLSEEENKLLFLALFNKTGMIEFRVPADPSVQVVQNNMERLLRFVGWQTALTKPNLVLPRFVVAADNRNLGNVKIWLETWEQRKKDWENHYRELSKDEKLQRKTEAMERIINSAYRKVESYSKMLADWVMLAANVPVELQEYWKPIFSLRDLDIYNARTADIEELLEHMTDNLDAYEGGIVAERAFRHIRGILERNKAGLNFHLGMEVDLEEIDPIAIQEKPYEFIEDVEEYNRIKQAATAPEKKPVKSNYPNTPAGRVEYLRANAAWVTAQRETTKRITLIAAVVAAEKEQKQQLDQDALDSSYAAEITEDQKEEVEELLGEKDLLKLQEFIKAEHE
jgi:hypothetical protein